MNASQRNPPEEWTELENLVRRNLDGVFGLTTTAVNENLESTPGSGFTSLPAARAAVELQRQLLSTFQQALTQYAATAAQPGIDPIEQTQHFIECYENAYQKMLRTEEYSRSFGAWVNALSGLHRAGG